MNVPILLNHDQGKVIGSLKMEGSCLRVDFAAGSEITRDVFDNIFSGAGAILRYSNWRLENPIIDSAQIMEFSYCPVTAAKSAQEEKILALEAEVARLNRLIRTPELVDFAAAVQLEAAYQREHWGAAGDAGKTHPDWFWLIGYLAGKALSALMTGDTKKALHHIITSAAACANWHAAVLGKTDMRPGIDTPKVP